MTNNFRKSTIDKNWKKINNYNPTFLIESIDLSDYQNFPKISLGKNLIVFSGLNGVGKSTILNKIIEAIDEESENLTIKYGNKLNKITELKPEERIILKSGYLLIDYHQADFLYNFFKQDNLEEYLDQYQTIALPEKEVKTISYLVGKDYEKIELTIVEEDEVKYPFFKVFFSEKIVYTTLEMGTGEHFLFYLFFSINYLKDKKLFLFEEPENFISIISQTRIMNWLAQTLVKEKASAIVVTHSPIILEKIPLENILLIIRKPNYDLNLTNPTSIFDIYKTLTYAGSNSFTTKQQGENPTFLVEDKVARYYLEQLFKNFDQEINFDSYRIVSTSGWLAIHDILNQSWSKFLGKFIAIFDGDVKAEDKLKNNKNYLFTFLPFDQSIEKEFLYHIKKDPTSLAIKLKKPENEIATIHQKYVGEDPHDFFELFIRDLDVSMSDTMRVLIDLQIENDPDAFNSFIIELNSLFDKC